MTSEAYLTLLPSSPEAGQHGRRAYWRDALSRTGAVMPRRYGRGITASESDQATAWRPPLPGLGGRLA